ncbi:C-GCAxxG-C-C family (seleno)protein [Sulfurospirillum diekertiae]|uniref:C-GCAxxG-C-C family (seleno)protein n=1 Tax=Sulfurospirillum diekertiae TaxID=1854492 RepID=UPI00350F5D93
MDELSLRLFKFSSAGFCCAQIMYKLALEDEGTQNDDLIRAAQGLCRGIADTQQTCGVLSGGIWCFRSLCCQSQRRREC